MSSTNSRWQTVELARAFLEGVRGAIPGADLQLEVLGKIIGMWCPETPIILDLGCGDGALGRMLLQRLPGAHVVFADFSEPMLDALGQRLGNDGRATVVNADFSTPDWARSMETIKPFDAVVSGFAIHHQPDTRKREIYGEIHELLGDGGVFLNLEHVSSAAPSGTELFDSFFTDKLVDYHLQASPGMTREEIEQAYCKRVDKEENILAPVETQCQWLRELGFSDVDCFLKVFELALFGGRKASRD